MQVFQDGFATEQDGKIIRRMTAARRKVTRQIATAEVEVLNYLVLLKLFVAEGGDASVEGTGDSGGKLLVKQMTYKEYFEKAKTHKDMKCLIIQCFISATKMIVKLDLSADIGELVLNSLSTMTEAFSGVELTNKEEITAEYMAEVLSEYSAKPV